MANQVTTTTPTALAGVTPGTTYYVQNTGRVIVYLETAAAAPTGIDNAFRIAANGGGIYFALDPGESVFVWSSRTGSHLVYSESV